jgi:ketosteroid isomerase-like protein
MICQRIAVGLLATFLLASCADPRPPVPDFDALFKRAYIEPYNAGDVDRWLEVFADNAVGMHNGLPPLEGRDAIRGFGEAVRDNFEVARIEATIDEVRQSGSWALTRGSYTAEFVPKAGTEGMPAGRQSGKFLLVWERQPDGEWRIILDMGNSNGPETPPG